MKKDKWWQRGHDDALADDPFDDSEIESDSHAERYAAGFKAGSLERDEEE